MSIYSSKRKSRRASRSQLGHLKLSVYEDSSALIIHVYEARGLMRRESAPMDTYVKLYLLPDPSKETKEKTKIHKQKDPVFNEKFNFILDSKEDIEKRLFISVWSHHTASRNEMIGCMSFKVSEIVGPDKGLNGWYQLLDEVKGQNEYHQVQSIARQDGPRSEPGVKTFAVTLVRSERGYGFSVDGRGPVFISQLLKGYPAAEADMRIGDRIVEAEGTDVTKASADLVVRILKRCPQVIHLILQRSTQPNTYASHSLRRPRKKGSLQSTYSQSQVTLNHRPLRAHRASLPPQGLELEYHTYTRRASAPHHDLSFTQPDYQPAIAEGGGQVITRWPSSSLARSREQLYASQGQLRNMDYASAFVPTTHSEMLTQPYDARTFVPAQANTVTTHTLTQPQAEGLDEPGLLVRTTSPRSKLGGMVSPGSRDSAYFSGQDSAKAEDSQPIDWESLGAMGQQRQRAMNNLLSTQQTLCEELQMGLETYVQPLRSVLSSESHQKMFLGLAELSAVTMTIWTQLKARRLSYTSDNAPVNAYIESVADLYLIHLSQLLDCLRVTQNNSGAARQEIATAFTIEQFSRLVEDSVVKDKKKSIYSFVEAVNEYIPKICKSMFALVFFTPLVHEDHRHLSSIAGELMSVCRDKDLVARWHKEQESMKRLQLCVGFGGKLKKFHIQTPGRLLIHEGELVLVERRKKRKVWVLLFSDLLLITQRQGKILTVVEEPLYLEQLTIQDFHCSDANEIQLSTVSGSWSRLLRAGAEAEKNVWMGKIKERASGSLANRRRDKPRSTLQPHIQDAIRKQSQQLQASAVAMETTPAVLSSVSPLGGVSSTDGPQPVEGTLLKRGSSKRRSLFNVGRDKREKLSPERDSKIKRSFRGKSPAPKKLTLADVSVETLKKWKISFDSLIQSEDGLVLFEEYLKSEFSEENIQFWKACQRFKTVSIETLASEANAINEEYILQRAPKWVNLDHQTTKEIAEKLALPDQTMFLKAQHQIYILMQRDSFKRFVESERFQSALKR